ncbi:MAG: hypothetical protein ACK41D_03260 [Rubricoccaceae bacterium]
MRRPALFLTAALAAALAAPLAGAQTQSDFGSIYSRFGVGERLDFSTSQASMLGLSGAALRAGLYNGLANPALGADQTLTTFSLGASVQGLEATDAADGRTRATSAELTGLQFGVPLYAGRAGVTLSYRPYSRVNYRAVETGSFISPADTAAFRANYEGEGGLQRASLGLGVRLGRAVQLGASADALFGRVEYVQRTEFPGATDLLETRTTTSTRVAGFTSTLGATVSAERLLASADQFTAGASVTLPARLTGEAARTIGGGLDRDTLSVTQSGALTLPLIAQGGLSYRASPRVLIAADMLFEPWSAFRSDFPLAGVDPVTGEAAALRDRLRAGAGAEIIPAGATRTGSLLRDTAYRFGAYAEQGLYAPADARVTTLALTGGLSIPTRFTATRFDLGLEVGTRGSTSDVLVRDVFVKGSATFNFGERWFIRRRLG